MASAHADSTPLEKSTDTQGEASSPQQTPSAYVLSSTLAGKYTAQNLATLQKHPNLFVLLDKYCNHAKDVAYIRQVFSFLKLQKQLTDSLSQNYKIDILLLLKRDPTYRSILFNAQGEKIPKLNAYIEIAYHILKKCSLRDTDRVKDLLQPHLRKHLSKGLEADISQISSPAGSAQQTPPAGHLLKFPYSTPPGQTIAVPPSLITGTTTPLRKPAQSRVDKNIPLTPQDDPNPTTHPTNPEHPVQVPVTPSEGPASGGIVALDTGAEGGRDGDSDGNDRDDISEPGGNSGAGGGSGQGGDDDRNQDHRHTSDPDSGGEDDNMDEKVPDYFEKEHCDVDSQPGTVPKEIPEWYCQKFQGDQSWEAKGAAIYVQKADIPKAEVTMLLSDLVPAWTLARTYHITLGQQGMTVISDVVPDVSSLSLDEKAKIDIIRRHYGLLTSGIKQLVNIKESLVRYCKASSVPPCIYFFKTLLAPLEQTHLYTQVYLTKCQGAESSNLDASSLNITGAPVTTSHVHDQSAMPAQFNLSVGGAKLPKLDMKNFTGKSEDWLRWRQDWEAYFAKWKGRVDPYQMFAYLHQSMPSHYQKEMRTYPWTQEGFDSWMDEMERRHGDPTHLLMTYRRNMQHMAAPKDNLGSFSAFRLKIADTCRGMEMIMKNSSKNGDEWLNYLLPKLTDTQRTSWLTYKQAVEFATPAQFAQLALFEHFKVWLERYERQLRENSLQQSLAAKSKPPSNGGNGQGGGGGGGNGNGNKVSTHVTVAKPASTAAPTTNAPVATTNAGQAKAGNKRKKNTNTNSTSAPGQPYKSERPKACCFCKQKSHHPAQCAQDLDRKKMWAQVFESSLCYCCLMSGHKPPSCRNKKKCTKKGPDGKPCPHFHAPILHDAQYLTVTQWEANKKK